MNRLPAFLLKQITALAVSFALVALSPGLEAPRLFAAIFSRTPRPAPQVEVLRAGKIPEAGIRIDQAPAAAAKQSADISAAAPAADVSVDEEALSDSRVFANFIAKILRRPNAAAAPAKSAAGDAASVRASPATAFDSVVGAPARLAQSVPAVLREAPARASTRFGLARAVLGLHIGKWREYRDERATAEAAGKKVLPASQARAFFVATRLLGVVGRVSTILGTRQGSETYAYPHVLREAARIVDLYFADSGLGAEERAAFLDYLQKQTEFVDRTASGVRGAVRSSLRDFSLSLPDAEGIGSFSGSMPAVAGALTASEHDRILNAFEVAVKRTLKEERRGSGKIVGVALRGSFVVPAATRGSGLDISVIAENTDFSRVRPFLERLKNRWKRFLQSSDHAIESLEAAYPAIQSVLLATHRVPYRVISLAPSIEAELNPPFGWYSTAQLPTQPTLSERLVLRIFSRILQLTLSLADVKDGTGGRTVFALDDAAGKRALVGLWWSRILINAGRILAWSYAFNAFVKFAAGPQAFADIATLGAAAAVLFSPISGFIADRWSLRNSAALLNIIRVVLSAAFILWAPAGYWPLLILWQLNNWHSLSVLVAESKLSACIAAGNLAQLRSTNGWANVIQYGINVGFGVFLAVGGHIDHLIERFGAVSGLSMVFMLNAGLAAAAGVLQWFTFPNVRLASAKAEGEDSSAPRRSRIAVWGLLMAAGLAAFVALRADFPQIATVPIIAVLLEKTRRSQGFKLFWRNPVLRSSALLFALSAVFIYPVQALLFPLASWNLTGGNKLQGELLGSFYFGQLLALLPYLRLQGHWGIFLTTGMAAAFTSWLWFYLFPAAPVLAAAGTVIGLGLLAASHAFSEKTKLRTAIFGLATFMLPLFFWGNTPLFLLTAFSLGLVCAPLKNIFESTFQNESARADTRNASTMFSASQSLGYIGGALGFAALNAITSTIQPAFPGVFIWLLAIGLFSGALFTAAPKWLQRNS